jgi:hypothetical protein
VVALAVALPVRTRAEAAAGLVVATTGNPTVTRAGASHALRRSDRVYRSDTIDTDANAKAKILLSDDSVLAIGVSSHVRISEFVLTSDDRAVQLNVLAGRFKLAVAKFFGGRSQYQVFTPTAVAGVRGTVLWGDTTLDLICNLDGSLEVRSAAGESSLTQLKAGECASQMGKGKVVTVTPTSEDLARYLREVALD